jgi:Tfp pilus assembly protein PilF
MTQSGHWPDRIGALKFGALVQYIDARNMRSSSLIVVLMMTNLLAACGVTAVNSNTGYSSALDLKSDLFGERPEVISVSEIHELSDEQRLAFSRYFDNPNNQDTAAHERVSDYLQAVTSDFSYLGETYTAREALDNSAGNCLALAILTTALAKIANVGIAYQLTDSLPVFESRGDHIRRGQHVRSRLYDPTRKAQEGFLLLSPRGITVDYFPSDFDRFIGNIDESDYFAMYYRNIAADAIEEQNLSKAYWLLIKSLELSPLSAESLNMLAIVNDRAGDKGKSEEIYRFGIQHATRRVSLLRNYGIFLRRQGRSAEAKKIDTILAKLDEPNPFDWIYAGQEAYSDGEFKRALRLFKKSVGLAPYLHEGYFGLAKAHFRLGNLKNAEQELELALSYATRSSTRRIYEAKLAALSENNIR